MNENKIKRLSFQSLHTIKKAILLLVFTLWANVNDLKKKKKMESTIALKGMFYIDFIDAGNVQIALEKVIWKKKTAFVKKQNIS